MKNLFVFFVFVVTVIGVNIPIQVISQDNFILTQKYDTSVGIDSFTLNKAKNYARQAAEEANGGLGYYRAESAMHGPAFDSPYHNNLNGTITFTFYGMQPSSTKLIYESVVTVNVDDFSVYVEYNGPIRDRLNIKK